MGLPRLLPRSGCHIHHPQPLCAVWFHLPIMRTGTGAGLGTWGLPPPCARCGGGGLLVGMSPPGAHGLSPQLPITPGSITFISPKPIPAAGMGAAPRPGALGVVGGGSGTLCPLSWGAGRAPGAAEVMQGKQAAGSCLRRGKILDKGEEGRMKAKTEGGLRGQTRLRCSHCEQPPRHHDGKAWMGQGR